MAPSSSSRGPGGEDNVSRRGVYGGMALDDRLLDLLRCPETQERLHLAPADVIARLNARIGRGALDDRRGRRVAKKIDGALIREDEKVAYPIRDGVPELLPGGGISLDQL